MTTTTATIPDERIQAAAKLLRTYAGQWYQIDNLAGPAKASCRAHVMSTLLGVKTPQSKAGITAIREAFYAAVGLGHDCLARQEHEFTIVMQRVYETI